MKLVPSHLVCNGLSDGVKDVIQIDAGKPNKIFHGVLGYIWPPIIIPKNVQSASWDAFARADTRKYHLPETRSLSYSITADWGTFGQESARAQVM